MNNMMPNVQPQYAFAQPSPMGSREIQMQRNQADLEPIEFRNWRDERMNPNELRTENVLDYFMNPTNIFYDSHNCINDAIRNQRSMIQADQIQMSQYSGIEYRLMHVREPLFVIKKLNRDARAGTIQPLANYYIIAGTVYQAPDLFSFVNSKVTNALNGLHEAFKETLGHLQYNSLKGYHWDFSTNAENKAESERQQAERLEAEKKSSWFQRSRVESLLHDLSLKYPPLPVPEDDKSKDSDGKTKVEPSAAKRPRT